MSSFSLACKEIKGEKKTYGDLGSFENYLSAAVLMRFLHEVKKYPMIIIIIIIQGCRRLSGKAKIRKECLIRNQIM